MHSPGRCAWIAAASAHLHQLARDHRPTPAGVEQVSDDIVSLIDQLGLPAFVAGRCPGLPGLKPARTQAVPNFTPGRNLLRCVVPRPSRASTPPRPGTTPPPELSASLREATAGETHDPRLDELVDELCVNSASFAEFWAKADVGYRPAGTSRLHHPEVGELLFRRNRFAIPDSDGQHLQIYHPEPGTATSEKLALLKTTAG